MLDPRRNAAPENKKTQRLPDWGYKAIGIALGWIATLLTSDWLDEHGRWALWILGSIMAIFTITMSIHIVRETKAIGAAHRRGERRR